MAYITILEAFQKTVANFGSNNAFTTLSPTGKDYLKMTFGEIDELSNKIAAGLQHRGVKPGEKVGILSKPRPEMAASMLGILKVGAVAVPIDPLLKKPEIHRILGACDVFGVIISGELFEEIEGTASPEFMVNIDSEAVNDGNLSHSWNEFLSDKAPTLHEAKLEDLAVFLNTSGTMGDAKPVMLTHNNFAANLFGVLERLEMTNKDILLSIAPWNHSFGLIVMLAILWTGASLIYTNDYANLAKVMLQHEPTIVVAVPKLYHAIYQRVEQNINSSFIKKLLAAVAPKLIGKKLKQKLAGGRLRFFASGSAPLSPRVMAGFRRLGLGMIEGYGMTESSPVLTFSTAFNKKIGSVGPPLSNVELKLIDINEEGIGELLARGPNVMQGYYKNDKGTREMLDDEGWLYTGDLATLDKEGWLYIRGRKKNVIVLESGKNVYPEEIEWELGRSLYIEDLLVRRGERKGIEVIQALAYPNFENIEEGLSAEEVKSLIWNDVKERNQDLASYKRIKSEADFVVIDEPFEKTSLKDIKRYKYVEKSSGTA
jgi:long-chain acyl-CoA synthetase